MDPLSRIMPHGMIHRSQLMFSSNYVACIIRDVPPSYNLFPRIMPRGMIQDGSRRIISFLRSCLVHDPRWFLLRIMLMHNPRWPLWSFPFLSSDHASCMIRDGFSDFFPLHNLSFATTHSTIWRGPPWIFFPHIYLLPSRIRRYEEGHREFFFLHIYLLLSRIWQIWRGPPWKFWSFLSTFCSHAIDDLKMATMVYWLSFLELCFWHD